jgi:hypothetical protein
MAIILGNDGSYDTIDTTLTGNPIKIKSSTLWFNFDETHILFDEGQKRITSNDGQGNFQVRCGHDSDNQVVSGSAYTGSGTAVLQMNTDRGSGGVAEISFNTSVWQTNGSTVDHTNGVSLGFNGNNGIYVGSAVSSSDPHTGTSGSKQIANVYRPYGEHTPKAWASYEQLGTHAFYDDVGFSSISDQGTGYSRLTFANTMPNENYCVTMMEGANSGGGAGGGADNANGNRPGTTSWVQIENRTTSNANYDKKWAAIVVFGRGTGN